MHALGGRGAAAFIVLAAATMTACSGESESDEQAHVELRKDTSDVAPIEEAFSVLTADVGLVDFSSDRHSAVRLGLVDEDATSYAEMAAAFDARRGDVPATDLAAVSSLASDVELMADGGAAFSQLDVRWSMQVTTGTDPLDDDSTDAEVFRLVDGVDMDGVVADLEDAGFVRSSEGGWEVLDLEGMLSDHADPLDGLAIAGRYPDEFFPRVSVHPESHLVALGDVSDLDPSGGGSTQELLAVLDAEEPAAVEKVGITAAGFMNCFAPVDKVTGNRATVEKINRWVRTYDIAGVGAPGATVLQWVPGEDVVLRAYFQDEPAAQRALTARERLFDGPATVTDEAIGVLMPADGNDSPYDPGWTISTRANRIEVRHNKDRPASAVETHQARGLGFDVCAP